jgi:hypothetical protein
MAFAPDWVEIGERFFRDGFQGGFPRGLQFLNAIARSNEHVPRFREVRFVAERPVPRNNLGVIVGECDLPWDRIPRVRSNLRPSVSVSTGLSPRCNAAYALSSFGKSVE